MILLALVGLALGVIVGWNLPLRIPALHARYLSIAILAGLDSVFGGMRAELEGRFEGVVFSTGFFSNMLLAAGLTYVGDKIGVELYLAAVVALGVRIFQNVGAARHALLVRFWKKR
ncbi:MAG: small basic family protein [Bacillota bacterium]